ncbi:amidohydrolase family protein [Nitrospirillum sp. BR 11164]|uniref:N-acyl-D-amino-acid deacylase family protein n=1 Tax=Nitrospirillum sp. BR 11164 TaxID=3104324 RepID=UPI002AFE2EDB|nr:amidohydrolase family protein [Nitrospirillum sp. BR 11164]MEA1652861.1 amidohydrolase family protein [Nitrospirillum sp. BR 11164]
MTQDYDLVIRGGTVVDGTGAAPFVGDVAISGSRIAAVGSVKGAGRQEINAAGLIVTPGFVDVHTHYDGQITWENRLTPSSDHGTTTVIMGNCGVGFAPARAADRQLTIKLMEGVEDIPEVVMVDGVPWNWESFPDYLDALDQRQADIDFAAQIPHSPLRVYVMGERGANLEPPTETDLAEMRRLTAEAITAGAIGVSTSRQLAHRFRDGRPAPSTQTEVEELKALAGGLVDAGTGVFQLIPNTSREAEEEFTVIRELAEVSGRPVNFSLLTGETIKGGWRGYMSGLVQARQDGLPISGQYYPRPIGMLFGLDLSYHPFSLNPSYKAIENLPLEEKVVAMRDPEMRARLLAEEPQDPNPFFLWVVQQTHLLFPLGDPPNYNPAPEDSIKARAAVLGVDERELMYDELLRNNGRTIIYCPMGNTENGRFDAAANLFGQPGTVLGLGDGGAHYGMICDAAYPTFLLTQYVRDQKRLSLEQAVSMLARETAASVGLNDRGILKPGYKADVNVIDLERLHLYAPRVKRDLPAGGRRLTQKADGYEATIVSGAVTYRNGRATGALPGRLVRGAKSAPAA